MEIREEVAVDESRGFWSTVAIVDANVGGGRRGEDLTLVLHAGIGLYSGDREVAGGVRLQVNVPQQFITAPPPQIPLQWPITARSQHPPLYRTV